MNSINVQINYSCSVGCGHASTQHRETTLVDNFLCECKATAPTPKRMNDARLYILQLQIAQCNYTSSIATLTTTNITVVTS